MNVTENRHSMDVCVSFSLVNDNICMHMFVCVCVCVCVCVSSLTKGEGKCSKLNVRERCLHILYPQIV